MNSKTNECGAEAKNYYMCRRERDAQLFTAIKEWEKDTYTKSKNKPGYVKDLSEQATKL
jgi:hypothetical protein